jgi:hypothetical protein
METKYSEIIDRFINGDLKGTELEEFYEKLKTDTQLQFELKLEHELNEVINDHDSLNFREEVNKVRSSMKEDTPNSRPFLKLISLTEKNNQWYLMAASVAVILGFAIYFAFIKDKDYTNDQLFATYYKPYPSSIEVRTGGLSDDNPIDQGFLAYQNGDFKNAENHFNLALEKDSVNIPVRFYLGISNLENTLYHKAEINFKFIINHQNNIFTEQAKWYLVLTMLKSGNDKNNPLIKNLLTEIIAEKGDRAAEAKKLLKKISQ